MKERRKRRKRSGLRSASDREGGDRWALFLSFFLVTVRGRVGVLNSRVGIGRADVVVGVEPERRSLQQSADLTLEQLMTGMIRRGRSPRTKGGLCLFRVLHKGGSKRDKQMLRYIGRDKQLGWNHRKRKQWSSFRPSPVCVRILVQSSANSF
ncbi:hypothetical protein BCV70DRAFT_60277 [Testicularia cyperi]|uniref:Uncharacterized protein n=1 Tax=Testicularia cyperi TaxID=1882483 RepID=A0A317XY94_9BASI|nr:hypothetical protein BCV70DRAFT_60277 [Testicularia cyperi]